MIHFGIIFIVLFVVALALLWMILDYQYIRMQYMLKQEYKVVRGGSGNLNNTYK